MVDRNDAERDEVVEDAVATPQDGDQSKPDVVSTDENDVTTPDGLVEEFDEVGMSSDADAPVQPQMAPPQYNQPEPIAFAWANYKNLREQQKLTARQEKAQGKPNALGYNQINPADKTNLQALQASLFNFQTQDGRAIGMCYSSLVEEEMERKRKLSDYYDDCQKRGAPISDIEKAKYQCFEDKLFDGYRLDKTMGQNPVLSFRVVDPSGRHQQVFDDGTNVRARTNGEFNATTAMAMATTFWGHRALGHKMSIEHAKAEGIDPNTVVPPMRVNLTVKKTLKGALGGRSADEKRNLLIVSNLHQAHKTGVPVDIHGKNIGNTPEDFQNYVANNQEALEAAVNEYRQTLSAMGEDANFDLGALLQNPITHNALENSATPEPQQEPENAEEHGVNTDQDLDDTDEIGLSGDDPDGPQDGPNGGGAEVPEIEADEKPLMLENKDPDATDQSPEVLEGEILDDDAPDPFTKKGADQPVVGKDADVPQIGKAVASEPRNSHGNAVPADPKHVDQTIKAEKAGPKPAADQALGLPSPQSGADAATKSGTTGASINPAQSETPTNDAGDSAPKKPRIPPHGAPGR